MGSVQNFITVEIIMKSFFRWRATLGLISSLVIGSVLGQSLPALSLPQEQVIQKLQEVPIFTITNNQGAFLLVSREDDSTVAYMYLSARDAQAALEKVKETDPELAEDVGIVVVPLSEVYKKIKDNDNQPDSPNFSFVPMRQQVQSAVNVFQNQERDVPQYLGVPLFFATVKEQGYLTYSEGDRELIPLFFEKEQLDAIVAKFKDQKPEEASNVEINVVPLESLMGAFDQKENDALRNMVIVPSSESIRVIQSLQQQQQNQSQP